MANKAQTLTSPQTLKCMYTNLDGLNNKTSELNAMLDKETPDIVFLTETKMNPEVLNVNIFNVKKYHIIRKDRAFQVAPGGGVVVLITKDLIVDETSVEILVNHAAEESVWREIKCRGGKDILLGVLYLHLLQQLRIIGTFVISLS